MQRIPEILRHRNDAAVLFVNRSNFSPIRQEAFLHDAYVLVVSRMTTGGRRFRRAGDKQRYRTRVCRSRE
jgi:hypothetical protein